MANPTTPVANTTVTKAPRPPTSTNTHCQWSPLPPAIEEQFAIMDKHIHAFALALYRLQKLCPLIKETPHVRALAVRMEHLNGMTRDTAREMHDKMSIPFKVAQTPFQDEVRQKSHIVLRQKVAIPNPSSDTSVTAETNEPDDVPRPEVDSTPEPTTAATTTTTTTTPIARTTSTRFRGEIPLVPLDLKRHGPDNLPELRPYSLQVRDIPGSPLASWHLPYKVIFTPDEKVKDVDGEPLPTVIVDVNEDGDVRYAWKNGSFDGDEDQEEGREKPQIQVADETCLVEHQRQDTRPKMLRKATLFPPQQIPPRATQDLQGKDNATFVTSDAIYMMGGRVMRDFLRVTQSQAEAATSAPQKRKREDETEIDGAGPETMKKQKMSSC